MAEPSYGDFSLPQTTEQIRDDLLADVRLEMINNGATLDDSNLAVQPGTFTHVLMTSVANTSYVTRSQFAVARRDLTPLYCSGVVLEQWRKALQLPDVSMSPSTGRIRPKITGTATIPSGREFVLPNGLRGHVVGTFSGITDGAEVDVITDDVGNATQLDGGQLVRFINPPMNVATEAVVSYSSPLTGGADKESDDRKRARVINRLAYAMGGGGWGYLRELALNALPQVDDCFVYPALGGPASVKIVPVRAYDIARGQFTRQLDAVALGIVRDAIHAHAPDSCQYVVTACEDQPVDVSIKVEIPAATRVGGDGSGWSDTMVWPSLASGNTRITVSSVTSQTVVTLDASTNTAPIPGLTRIAWWSPTALEFIVRTVTGVSGSSTAWVITLDRPLIDSRGGSVAIGDFISPSSTRLSEYGAAWVQVLGKLGCGENVGTLENRRKRHPFISDGPKASLTITELMALREQHPEIIDVAWSYRSSTFPATPAAITSAPRVLVPRHFGVYQL